jgi:hypothetical protein
MDIFKSIVRFAYQPGTETTRAVAAHYSWKAILAVLVVTGFINMADPTLYVSDESRAFDIVFNLFTLGPIGVCVFAFVSSAVVKWLFSLSRITTSLKDNMFVCAWSGVLFPLLILPSVWLSLPFADAYEMVLVVYTLVLVVVAYRALTGASWLHIIGTFIAAGFIAVIAGVLLLTGLDATGILPAEIY